MHIGGLCLWLRQIKIMNYVAKKTSTRGGSGNGEGRGSRIWPKPHVPAVRETGNGEGRGNIIGQNLMFQL